MSDTKKLLEQLSKVNAGHMEPEDIIANLQITVKSLAEENGKLEEELRIARSDNATLKEAIVNHFVKDHFNG